MGTPDDFFSKSLLKIKKIRTKLKVPFGIKKETKNYFKDILRLIFLQGFLLNSVFSILFSKNLLDFLYPINWFAFGSAFYLIRIEFIGFIKDLSDSIRGIK